MASTMELHTRQHAGSLAVVSLDGELDMGSVWKLDEALDRAIGSATPVVVDLRGLTFIDSDGLHCLLGGRDRAWETGVSLSLVPGPKPVARVFEITELVDVFTWVDLADGDGGAAAVPLAPDGSAATRPDR